MITEETVYACLSIESATSFERINIALHDESRQIVLGKDALGRLTLVFGDVEGGQVVSGQIAEVATDETVTLEPSGSSIRGAVILFCRTSELSTEELTAFASIIVAICQLRSTSEESTLVSALVGLVSLLNRRSLRFVNSSTVVGLMGELLVLLASEDPHFHFECWRSDPSSDFDFSADDARLEVKTTTQGVRQHEFSSTQFISGSSEVFIASVRLLRVESGSALIDLIAKLSDRLDSRVRAELVDRVNLTLGCPYMLVNGPQVDLENSRGLIRLWPQSLVPRIPLSEGILWARWGVLLPEEQPAVTSSSPLVRMLQLEF